MQDLLCDLTDFKPSLSVSGQHAYAVGSSANVVSQLIEIDLNSWQVASVIHLNQCPHRCGLFS
jgi:hypothetical protein